MLQPWGQGKRQASFVTSGTAVCLCAAWQRACACWTCAATLEASRYLRPWVAPSRLLVCPCCVLVAMLAVSRLLVRGLAEGLRVLDLCSYTGGFALSAALGGAEQVIGASLHHSC